MAQDRSAATARDTINFSDLDPETASKIKAEHYSVLGQNIQQTYHQQLNENRQRTAFNAQQAAYGQSVANHSRRPQYLPGSGTAAPATPIASFPRTTPGTPPAPVGGYQSPQSFMPPVHIVPPQHPYTAGYAARPSAGNRHGVQNFAPQTDQRRAAVAHRQQPVVRQQPTPTVAPAQRSPETQPVENDSRVFLQDRIANALTRRFKRDEPTSAPETDAALSNEIAPTPAVQEVAHSVMEFEPDTSPEVVIEPIRSPARTVKVRRSKPQSDIVFNAHTPSPLQTSIKDVDVPVQESFDDEYTYAEILQSNQYATQVNEVQTPQDRPVDHNFHDPTTDPNTRSEPTQRTARTRRSVERAIHHDDQAQVFEVNLDEDESLLDRYQTVRQTSAQHSHDDDHMAHTADVPATKKRTRRRQAPQARVAATPRPDRYGTSDRRTSGENVSVFLSQEEDDFAPRRDDNNFRPREDFRGDAQRDRDNEFRDQPNRRDDLRDAGPTPDRNDRPSPDRVRSRLNDELDLDTLDSDLDNDQDEDEDFVDDRPVRVPQKSCREYQNELIAGSIRDISMDISPPAVSEGAQFGGLARTWTDRRGNILATGALVDLRRGYVILDSGQKLAYARLSESDLAAVSEFWRLPEVCVIGNSGGSPYRNWTPQAVTWKASNLCHKPLFFENIQLERYGHSRGPIAQPIHSTLHFFVSLVSVPYNTAISPPNECEYALGFYRPGNCAPWLKEPVPISLQGIRREALFVTGAAFIP